jgi:dCMP deaminase
VSLGVDAWGVAPKSDGRPSWDDYFLDIAVAVAARADCRRARYGAVIVDGDNRIVSTGYNGGPRWGPSCLQGKCPRGLLSQEELAPLHPDYSNCVALHAETNAIAFARTDCRGATLYIAERDGNHRPPCDNCEKLVMASGISRVITPLHRLAVTSAGLRGMGAL